MLDEKINQKYSKKIKLFQKYNKHYYDLNDPLVNDQEFDKLKQEIIDLEKKYHHYPLSEGVVFVGVFANRGVT